MQNSMFDNLKDLKKDIAQNEKETNEKIQKDLNKEKEGKLKVDFETYMKSSGIKKIK